jgi:hypothetical protein
MLSMQLGETTPVAATFRYLSSVRCLAKPDVVKLIWMGMLLTTSLVSAPYQHEKHGRIKEARARVQRHSARFISKSFMYQRKEEVQA